MTAKRKFFTHRKVAGKAFGTHNLTDWFEYLYKKKSRSLNVEFRNVYFDFKSKYSFLDESQVNGKVYSFLGIPNICGIIDKKKFRQLVTNEKKLNKDLCHLKIKKTKPIKATKTKALKHKFFSSKKTQTNVKKEDDPISDNSWFDDVYLNSYQSPPEFNKSPDIESRFPLLNINGPDKSSGRRFFSTVCKWSTLPGIQPKFQNSPEFMETNDAIQSRNSPSPKFMETNDEIQRKNSPSPEFMETNDEIQSRNSPSWNASRHRSQNATEPAMIPDSSPASSWSSFKLQSPRLFVIDRSPNNKQETYINLEENINASSHELDEIKSCSSFNDYDTGIMSVEYDPEMYARPEDVKRSESENLSPIPSESKSPVLFPYQEDGQESVIRSSPSIDSVQQNPAMPVREESISGSILMSETDLEISVFSSNAPAKDDLLFEGRLVMDRNKKIVSNQYMSSNKASLSKTIQHFEKNLTKDIEVVPTGIFGYLKNQNDEPIIKPVSLREIISISEEKSVVVYPDLSDDSSESDESSSPTIKLTFYSTILLSDSDLE